MRAIVWLLIVAASLVSGGGGGGGRISNVVVLMLENRSFDHMFGLVSKSAGLNSTNNWNPVDPRNPSKGKVVVDTNPPYVARCGPDHTTNGTTAKIFPLGIEAGASMMGFVAEEASQHPHNDSCGVMSSFPEGRLPVLHYLAKEYALFDRWFSSHPGPTWPNRWFTLLGTSASCLETGEWYLDQTGTLFLFLSCFFSSRATHRQRGNRCLVSTPQRF